MTMQDPIADMLTRIRNAQSAKIQDIDMPCSEKKIAVARVLKEEGYIEDYSVNEEAKPRLQIALKFCHTLAQLFQF